jgi:hypothetical protein
MILVFSVFHSVSGIYITQHKIANMSGRYTPIHIIQITRSYIIQITTDQINHTGQVQSTQHTLHGWGRLQSLKLQVGGARWGPLHVADVRRRGPLHVAGNLRPSPGPLGLGLGWRSKGGEGMEARLARMEEKGGAAMGGDGRRDGRGRWPSSEGRAGGGLVARGRRAPVREQCRLA